MARSVTSSTVRTQQIVTLTVPAGVGAGVITVSTAGGNAMLRTGVGVTANPTSAPAA